jgi:multisubunit Na+/H+ antiporter MnhF subunit
MTNSLLLIIAIILAIELGLKIYLLVNGRAILDRLAAIILDRWLDGQGTDKPLY